MSKPRTPREVYAKAALAPWFQALARLQQVQGACDAALAACGLPPDACVVEGLADGQLRLTAASPAAAVRLRQTFPSLVHALCAQGLAVRSCRIAAVRSRG